MTVHDRAVPGIDQGTDLVSTLICTARSGAHAGSRVPLSMFVDGEWTDAADGAVDLHDELPNWYAE